MMEKKPEKYVQIIGFTLFAIGIALIFLFSWKTNPNVGEYSFLPDWLINWADQYRNNRKRTGVPFIFLGFLAGAYLIYIKQKSLRFWILTGVILVLTVIIAELGQYFIPSRDPDPKDVLWGSIGAGIGLLPIFIFNKITTHLKK